MDLDQVWRQCVQNHTKGGACNFRDAAFEFLGKPKWRCFHCDEVFCSEADARLHFGNSERQSPACTIDVAEYRAMEQRMVAYNDEDADIHRQMHAQSSAHQTAKRRAEEAGYSKGVTDVGNIVRAAVARLEATGDIAQFKVDTKDAVPYD